MLGGVRGAISIALATTITATALVSENDITIIKTMVFGVAFISILFQVPILLRYAKNQNICKTENLQELNQTFESIEAAIAELKNLRAKGKITSDEYEAKFAEYRAEINEIIDNCETSIPTKQILQERASTLFTSIPKIPLHTKKQRKKDPQKDAKSVE